MVERHKSRPVANCLVRPAEERGTLTTATHSLEHNLPFNHTYASMQHVIINIVHS